MGLINNTYAFDDSSILGLCEIKIPSSHKIFFEKNVLTTKNYPKLKLLMGKLNKKNIPPFRFAPAENIEQNIIKVANQILEGYHIQMLGNVFKVEVMDQLKEFADKIKNGFREIIKGKEIDAIKEIFVNNQKKLGKNKNDLPQDDDLKIIAGYYKYQSDGNKYLISGDEHFWGYADLILNNFKICVIKEWECHLTAV